MNTPSTAAALKWKVFGTPSVPTVSDDLPPGETARMWSPISSTLIYGERDAVLVDTPTTNAQATALADWVEKSGKNLTPIYTTHGYGDDFFGNRVLLELFPGAKAVAAPKVLEMMQTQVSPPTSRDFGISDFQAKFPKTSYWPSRSKARPISRFETRVRRPSRSMPTSAACFEASGRGSSSPLKAHSKQ